MTDFRARVLLNVSTRMGRRTNFDGYVEAESQVAWATTPFGDDLVFSIEAGDAEEAADTVFVLGNRQCLPGTSQACDRNGTQWPGDIRSVSVGDVVEVEGPGGVVYLALRGGGFRMVTAPTSVVALGGSTATSRP